MSRDARLVVSVLGVVVTLVLLVACANAAGLLLARAAGRRREIVVRLAVGASRWRLVRESLIESLLLALLAAALGLILAHSGLRLVQVVTRGVNPFFNQLAIDRTVLAVGAGLALVTPLIFGLAPALRGNPGDALKSAATRGTVGTRPRGRRLLVVSQFAMTMALLAVTSLFVRTMLALRAIELGFDPDRILMVRMELPEPRSASLDVVAHFSAQTLAVIQGLSGVAGAAATSPCRSRTARRRWGLLSKGSHRRLRMKATGPHAQW